MSQAAPITVFGSSPVACGKPGILGCSSKPLIAEIRHLEKYTTMWYYITKAFNKVASSQKYNRSE
jgi:hypothetical protein